jgi:hypothetical protein
MPKCYKCDQPVIFVNVVNEAGNLSDKAIPVNLEPDNAGGIIALVQWPFLFKGTKPFDGREIMTVARKIYGEAAKSFRRDGGSLYRVHWDTCRGAYNYGKRRF